MNDHPPALTLTRQELYERAWATPIERLAKEFGISGRGLSKICARLDVPVPSRGYWAKVAAGKKAVKFKLPAPGSDTILNVTISATPEPAAPDPFPASVETIVAKEKQRDCGIKVAKTLKGAHPVVQGWLDTNAADIASGRKWCSYVPDLITKTLVQRRRLRILSALFKELERRGHKVNGGTTYDPDVVVSGQRVEFRLHERTRRTRYELPPGQFTYDRKFEFRTKDTGELQLEIKSHLYNNAAKVKWKDLPDQPLEEQMADIVLGFVTAGALLVELDRERKEEARIRAEEDHKRYEREQREKIDENRWLHVIDMAKRWRRTREAAMFLKRFEALALAQAEGGALGAHAAEWFAWAKARLKQQNPLSYYVTDLIGQNGQANSYSRPMQWADEAEPKPRYC